MNSNFLRWKPMLVRIVTVVVVITVVTAVIRGYTFKGWTIYTAVMLVGTVVLFLLFRCVMFLATKLWAKKKRGA